MHDFLCFHHSVQDSRALGPRFYLIRLKDKNETRIYLHTMALESLIGFKWSYWLKASRTLEPIFTCGKYIKLWMTVCASLISDCDYLFTNLQSPV